jgi:hypothetical protein
LKKDQGVTEDNSNESPGTRLYEHKCETIDDGTEAFMHWMSSTDKKSLNSGNPIVLLKFNNDVHTLLFDTTLSKEVDVESKNGIPFCNYCNSDDCAHVGFTICLEQLEGHNGIGKEETVDEIVADT